jgi:DNA repair exonuclease SbcCD ATPase subunit
MYNNPFIKVTWEDTFENFTPEKTNRVKTYFQKKYNSKNVRIVPRLVSYKNETTLHSLDLSENITDFDYQKNLMKDFISENKIDVKWDVIERLDNKVNGILINQNGIKIKYNKWFLEKVEFSNFLSYGKNNVIDFTVLPGITVVESNPKNFGGKSTATVDLLMFLFFNKTTKSKTNIEIFNRFSDEDTVLVKGYIKIDGESFIIERKSNRKKTKTGEYNVTNSVEFSKINEDGTIVNLNGEQRKETELFIVSAIGTEEDFLSTILTNGYNLEEIIESKPTARGQILTKFLGLEVLKQKEEICKTIQSEWSKKLLSNQYNISDLDTLNKLSEEQIINLNNDRVRQENELDIYEKDFKKLENKKEEILKKRNNDVQSDLIKINLDQLKKDISDLMKEKEISLNNLNLVTVKEPSQYYIEEDHDNVKKELNDITFNYKILLDETNKQEKLIVELENGSFCPTCKQSLSDVDHTEEINNIKKLIDENKNTIIGIENNISEVTKKEKFFSSLKTEFDEYERNKIKKSRYEIDIELKQISINKIQDKIDEFNKNKEKLNENIRIDGELLGLKTQIETIVANIKRNNKSIENIKNMVLTFEEKIKINKELINKIKQENDTQSIFKIYLTIFGKNGISKVILKNMIPLINQELYHLLVDSCYFILELNINDKNDVELVMIDTETRVVKPINSGSGYERTISSLAIRSVLSKISALPKPNIIVMDEVFGKIADENLEMVGEFFKKIKIYFDHIFVISHNPLIRNWSDNLIMIKKDNNISLIEDIVPKIS